MGLANDLSTYHLHSRETPIETILEEKDFGVTFDNKIKFVPHIQSSLKKIIEL